MKYLLSLIILTSCVFIINAQEHLEVDGAINIQKAVGTGLGTIEYNGAMDDFRGRTTAGWKSFTSGTGGSSLWSTITGTNHIGYTAGNVAIGGTSVTGSMLSLEGNTQSMLRLQGTGSGGAYQQFFSNGSYWGLIGDENGDGSDLYFDIKSRSGASGIAFSTSTLNNAMRIENNGQVQISNLPAAADTDSYVTADASGKLRKKSASSNSAGNYGTVVSPVTGKVWLDRNLGATQVATSSTDAASYGDLYQWGRAADGHQVRTSATQGTQATTWLADEGSKSWDGRFIIGFAEWLSTGETDLWSGTAAENNPCPSGFRLPTNAEWNQERRTWSSDNAAGAFASPLKLPLGGARDYASGTSSLGVGTSGYYWSSTVSGTFARSIFFNSGNANLDIAILGDGLAVRCIKD